jgi:nucleoside-diphosphate-sugar epimerase
MRVVITGAAGRIGTEIIKELSGSDDLGLIDLRPVNGLRSIIANLSQPSPLTGWRNWTKSKPSHWIDAFKNAEVVVHLAASTIRLAPWKEVLPHNIQATWNVLEAAAKHHVRRVVFASSNWAVRARELELAPGCYLPEGQKIGSNSALRPVNAYGVSKAFGEIAGKMFVDQNLLESFVAVRIGHYSSKHLVKGARGIYGFTQRICGVFSDAVLRRNLRVIMSFTAFPRNPPRPMTCRTRAGSYNGTRVERMKGLAL